MLLCVPAFHVPEQAARERNRTIEIAIWPPKGPKKFLPFRRLVECVGVVDGVSGFVAQIHHDLPRIFKIVHLFLQPRQFWIGQVKRNADHRFARRASPLVSEIAKRTKFLQPLGLKLTVELLHKPLQRRALQLEPKLTDGLTQNLLNFRRSFFKGRHSGLAWRLARRTGALFPQAATSM